MYQLIEDFFVAFAGYAWGMPLLVLLLGGGLFFTIYIRLIPFRYFGHAIDVLRGKYDKSNALGDINHFEALSSALAATVGMGNIGGVALAMVTGGPGALFWMWVSAIIGITTKFFTCTLAVMYRGKDSLGHVEGGPMYVITEGLGKKWRPLSVLFCVAGIFGCLPIFQANQLTEVVREMILIPNDWVTKDIFFTHLIIGLVLSVLVGSVILGGIKRIAHVASKMVPFMVIIYMIAVIHILLANIGQIPVCFALIFRDAFTGDAVKGGMLGTLIIAGARRAAFSNEAGIGTAPMVHGAAKTAEPVREGLVAMLGPIIDTLIVCTATALAILITGLWQQSDIEGIALTAKAFSTALPNSGHYILFICTLIFSITSMFSFSYYGTKCFSFLAGAEHKYYFNYFYIAAIIFGTVSSISAVISLIDGMFALMSIPTMISTIILAPKVKTAAIDYFHRLKQGRFHDN